MIRCSIETASALARTTASESIGRGSSGATSLISAALDERSPKSPGSTAGSTDQSGAILAPQEVQEVSQHRSRQDVEQQPELQVSRQNWSGRKFWETLDVKNLFSSLQLTWHSAGLRATRVVWLTAREPNETKSVLFHTKSNRPNHGA